MDSAHDREIKDKVRAITNEAVHNRDGDIYSVLETIKGKIEVIIKEENERRINRAG
jgi:hypothetical protein